MARYRTEKKALSISKFRALGNLAFYPNSPDVADPSRHFFYFNTLLTDYARGGREQYRITANRIGNAAVKALTNSPFGNTEVEKENRSVQRIREALEVVDEGIRYEQVNELKYIEQRLNKLDRLTKESGSRTKDINLIDKNLKQIRAQVQEAQADKSGSPTKDIDYRLLIDTINIALQGRENAKAIYKYEYERLDKDVSKRFLAAREAFSNQVGNYMDSHRIEETDRPEYYERAMQKFDRISTDVYLRNHTYNINNLKGSIQQKLKAAMVGTKTIDVVMGEKITAYLNEIFSKPDIQQQLADIIQKHDLDVNGYAESGKEMKPIIIGLINAFANAHVADIIKGNLDVENIIDDFEKEINRTSTQEYQIQISGLYKNFAQYGHQLDFFKNGVDAILKEEQSAAGLYDAIVLLRKDINKQIKEKKVSGLDPETREVRAKLGLNSKNSKFNEIITTIQKLEKLSRSVKKAKNPTKLPSMVLPGRNGGEKVTLSIKEKNGEIVVEGLDKLGQTSIAETLNIKQTYKPKSLKDAVAYFKRKTSEDLRDSLREIITDAADKGLKDQVYSQLKSKLENMRISVGGPIRSEINGAIQQGLTDDTIWSGKLDVKNDVISISIDVPTLFSFKLDSSINKLAGNISTKITEIMEKSSDEYSKAYVSFVHNSLKGVSKDRKYTDYERLTQEFLDVNAALNKKYNEIAQAFKETEAELRQLMDQEEDKREIAEKILSQQQDFLNELRDTIYVSSTMKTFNHYQNHIGFVGGSIGADAATQISNLNILFQKAGIGLSEEEIDWLTFAVINNSPQSVIGLKNETLIETILGSLAVFAMFDEGGAELVQLRQRINDATQEMITPNIMHLYLVNGVYYPGSYVLATVRRTLLEMLDTISEVSENKAAVHNSIRISNTVNMGDLPNRKVKETEATLDTGAWGTMSETANKKTQIHVIFLAGLLDVLRELQKEENGIYLP